MLGHRPRLDKPKGNDPIFNTKCDKAYKSDSTKWNKETDRRPLNPQVLD